jgi:hypothetical protein
MGINPIRALRITTDGYPDTSLVAQGDARRKGRHKYEDLQL